MKELRYFIFTSLIVFALVQCPIHSAEETKSVQLSELLKQLKDPNVETRRLAAKTFKKLTEKSQAAVISDPASITNLVNAIDDPDAEVRADLIAILKAFPQSELALACLIAHLNDPDVEAAENAASELRYFEGEKAAALPILVEILSNPNTQRKQAAIWAIRDFGKHAKGAIPKLKILLSDPDPWIRMSTIDSLQEIGLAAEEGVPLFTAMLSDTDSIAREGAAKALGRYGASAKNAVEQLTALVTAENREDSQASIEALGNIGPDAKASLPALETELKVAKRRNAQVARAIWKISNEPDRVVPGLVELIKKKNDEAACDVLAEMGPPAKDAVPILAEVVQIIDWDLQWAAADALASIGPDAAPAAPALVNAIIISGGRVPSSACHALKCIGAPAVEPICEQLRLAPKHRDYLLDALSEIRPPQSSALPVIRECLEDKDADVRNWAAIAYANIDPSNAEPLPILISALEDAQDSAVRRQAALAIGEMGQNAKTALPVLNRAHTRIAEQLGKKPNLRGPSLTDMLQGETRDLGEVDVWLATAVAIARIDNTTAMVPTLILGLQQDEAGVLRGCVKALGAIGHSAEEAVPELEKLTTHKSAEIRAAAVEAIKRIRQ